ncbi:Auxin-induced protein 22E [Hibiscus syriacus]|uniref:Auxin-responsive protein n=1 Tax=Hibiscus syriacus TaxID=106335 RepID=A0A6A3CMD0_HIBSY|nr:Auxin-induced protein 22E [Hibiscus syriacus]
MTFEKDLNLDANELRLGLPGTSEESKKQASTTLKISNKRALPDMNEQAQVVGWPPILSYRKNSLQTKKTQAETCGMYVKVSMDGAPYLRKIDLKMYKGYPELLKAMEGMFKFKVGKYSEREGYNGSEFMPTYEDKDGDWMLVGDYHGRFRLGNRRLWGSLVTGEGVVASVVLGFVRGRRLCDREEKEVLRLLGEAVWVLFGCLRWRLERGEPPMYGSWPVRRRVLVFFG